MQETTVYLIRHAQANGNIERRFQGHYDGKISEMGEEQLTYLAKRFATVPLDAIYSSPLSRAYRTAEAVNQTAELPIQIDEDLMEIHGGDFEGVFFSELPVLFPEAYALWQTDPSLFVAPGGGESMRAVYLRMQKALAHIVEENPGKQVAVVSHGCAIRNYLCYATGVAFAEIGSVNWCDNTAVSKLRFSECIRVDYVNDASHLPPKAATFTIQDWWQTPETEGTSAIEKGETR